MALDRKSRMFCVSHSENFELNPGQRNRSLTVFCIHQSVMIFTICYVISSVRTKGLSQNVLISIQ